MSRMSTKCHVSTHSFSDVGDSEGVPWLGIKPVGSICWLDGYGHTYLVCRSVLCQTVRRLVSGVFFCRCVLLLPVTPSFFIHSNRMVPELLFFHVCPSLPDWGCHGATMTPSYGWFSSSRINRPQRWMCRLRFFWGMSTPLTSAGAS